MFYQNISAETLKIQGVKEIIETQALYTNAASTKSQLIKGGSPIVIYTQR